MAVVRRLLIALLIGLLSALPASAQDVTGIVRGRVVDVGSQQPLPDVQVSIEGTRRRAITGADGSFIIVGVPPGTFRIRASRIGHAPFEQVITVVGGSTVDVSLTLERRAVALQDVVTVGYGTQRRVALTGSISTIDADQANVGVATNVNSLIQGRAAGVYIAQNSGEPGAGAQIRIRGGTSISASNDPLYVIDGVPVVNVETEQRGMYTGGPALGRSPLNGINPSDIESISILKDAAASIYGTRAANGVILIETKKGTVGGAGVEYEFYVGRSSPQRSIELLNGDEYRAFVTDQVALKTACLAAPPVGGCNPIGLDASRLASLGTANTNWEDQVTRSSNTLNHNMSFSGGSASTRYRASMNVMDQQGVAISSGFKRYQARLNGTHQALDGRLRLGLNLTGSQIRNDYLMFGNDDGFAGGVFVNMMDYNPTLPVYVTDPVTGQTNFYEIPGQTDRRNPVGLAEQIQDQGRTTLALGNISADLDLFSNLTGTVNIGVDRTDGRRQSYWPRVSLVGASFGGRALQSDRDNTLVNLSTVLTYRPQFSDRQSFDILGGYEFSGYTMSEFGAEAQNFLTDAFSFNRLESGATLRPPTSYKEESRIVGFFTRANWSLMDRFFLTGSIRKDGSSRFGSGNKWATFPAVSGSWRITESGFMKYGPLNELRIRAGWGKLGNPAVPPYASLLLLSADAASRAVFGTTAVTGVAPFRNPNPNLKWESTAQTNVALDYGFSNNRFTGSLEYYVKNTDDLLLEVAVPQPAVVTTRLENIGKVQGKGLEFSLDAQVLNRPEMNWSAGLVFSRDRTKVVDLGGRSFISSGDVSGRGMSGQVSQRIIPGQQLGTFWGPTWVGVDAQGRELFACTPLAGPPADTSCVGGQTRLPIRDTDFGIIGNANPSYTFGIRSLVNWRRFDFSFLVNSQRGMDVLNNTALVFAAKNNVFQGTNLIRSALDDGVGITQPQTFSSRFIEDGSFVRLQNVTLGVTFDPPSFTGAGKGARAYISGDNLLLMTDYTGYDPEVFTDRGLASRGLDWLHYPRPRTITGGIRVTF
jgi:TonB-linked SusC/RagA family outer membrane protein